MPDRSNRSSDTWRQLSRPPARYFRQLGDAAEDLNQEALARALARPPRDGSFGPWVERIRQNLAVDGWRRQTRHQRATAPAVAPYAPSGEEAALGAERRIRMRAALAKLPPEQRRPIILRFFLGASDQQAARRLGIAQGTVRSRIHRALMRLRSTLGQMRAAFLFGHPAQLAVVCAVWVAVALPTGPAALSAAMDDGPRHPAARSQAPFRTIPRLAQSAETKRQGAPPTKAASPTQRFDFESDLVEGEIQAPFSDTVISPARPRASSLIELRFDFVPELLKTLEDI